MPNPRAQQQLAQVSPNPLDRAVHSLKSISQPAQALGDMLASTLRGSTAATLGAGGDIRELVDLLGPEKVEAMLGKRSLPTTEEMKGMLPKATSYEHPYESIGEFLPLPGTGAAIKAAGYGAGRGAGALTRAAAEAVNNAHVYGQGPLSAITPQVMNVVKPKGGNWLTGSVEKTVEPLMKGLRQHELDALLRNNPNMTPERRQMFIDAQANLSPEDEAINKWVGSNLAGYMKNQMGTPEDPVRALFETRTQDIEAKYNKAMEKSARLEQRAQSEQDPRRAANFMRESQQVADEANSERDLLMQHITHFPANEIDFANKWIPEDVAVQRMKGGFPTHGLGKSPAAQAWETMSDQAIYGNTAESYRQPLTPSEIRQGYGSLVDENPWLTKLDPETMVYHPEGSAADLGLDHVLDVLKQDVAAGRIRPEQLNKVSMEQAVQRAAEFDLEQTRKMREARIQQQEGFPVHKDYGDQGYKWIELAPSKEKKIYTAENLPEGFELEKDRDGFYQIRNRNLGEVPTTNSLSRNPEESIAKFNKWAENKDFDLQRALKYEGDTMGHCVGGYCPDVLEGRSRIYSLRDKKGEPHVTVEVQPKSRGTKERTDWFASQPEDIQDKITQEALELEKTYGQGLEYGSRDNWQKSFFDVIDKNMGEEIPSIVQIKGKQNRAPKEDYLPYVQDFVKGGEWSDVGDLHNTGLKHISKVPEAEQFKEAGIDVPNYVTDKEHDDLIYEYLKRTSPQADPDFMAKEYGFPAPEEGMKAGGCVSISDNPDRMWMEVQDQKFAGGGLTKLAKLARAPAKTKAEIEAIAERMAPQVTGEYVRASEKSAKTVAGKTKKQFEREKELQHDIRPTGAERPLPKAVNIEDLKNSVMMGIAGDPTVTGQTLHSVAGRELRSPSPQHGGPLYGLGHDKEHFWASNLGAAQGVQNRAREIGQQYDAPVVGNYVMMGPDSYSYAQHFADANLQNIRPEEMTKAQIEGFNKLVRQGSLKSGPRPTWPGIENPDEAYLHMAVDPELRKHFGNLMQMPTVTEAFGLPSGLDVRHAVTEPDLRNLQIGVTGKSMGLMRPEVTNLKLSEHPTYSHDIPGEFMGGLKFPVPYELSFPDSLKAVRENPAQAPQEFGSFKMAGPRQIIDQQLIDEIKAYEERMRQLTGKADGGSVKQLSQTAQEHLAKLKAIRDQLAPVADAWTAKQAEDANKYTPDIQQFKLPIGKAAGGEISADDIILEERPL